MFPFFYARSYINLQIPYVIIKCVAKVKLTINVKLGYNIYFLLRFIFVFQKTLKQKLQTVFFLLQNHLLNLWSHAVNS